MNLDFTRHNSNTHTARHNPFDQGGSRQEQSREESELYDRYKRQLNLTNHDKDPVGWEGQPQNPPTVSLLTAQNDPVSVVGGKVSFSHDTSNVVHDAVAPTPAVPASDTTPDQSGDAKKSRSRTTKLKVRRPESAPVDVVVSVVETLPESK